MFNKVNVSFAVAAVMVAIGFSMVQGCSLGDIVKHPIPVAMQPLADGQPKVSVNEYPGVREAFVQKVTRDLNQGDASHERALVVFTIGSSLLNLGFEQIDESVFPGGMAVIGLLSTLAALFTKRPGTDKAEAAARDATWDEAWAAAIKAMGAKES